MKCNILKKNKFILTLIICYSVSASAIDCKSFNTRYIDNKKTITKSENLCLLELNKVKKATSKNCLFATAKSCPFSKIKSGANLGTFIRDVGSPGFNICHELKGSPQIYDIKVQGQWEQFERCYWKNSKEFVDISDLIEIYKAF